MKHVWIAYDRDEAGDNAAEQLKKELAINTARVLFPRGMDANEYALKVTPASQSFAVLLNRTEKPPMPASETAPQIAGDEITLQEESRRYRIRGLQKNLSHELLKVNLLVSCGDLFHVDTLDLYSARQRAAFTKQASEELHLKEETLRRDLGRVLMQLEKLQDEQIRKILSPDTPQVEMTTEERAEAMTLLRDPKLLDRILEHFEACGIVGEETNKLIGYLAAVSRHLDTPLAVVVQSSSAAGKSSLMDAVLAFVPEEERIQYSAMTGQSLYYMDEMDLKHKVLAIVEEEGASRAAYALKLLQSEGVLSIASTGKDPATGKLVTHQYRVEGPVMMFNGKNDGNLWGMTTYQNGPSFPQALSLFSTKFRTFSKLSMPLTKFFFTRFSCFSVICVRVSIGGFRPRVTLAAVSRTSYELSKPGNRIRCAHSRACQSSAVRSPSPRQSFECAKQQRSEISRR